MNSDTNDRFLLWLLATTSILLLCAPVHAQSGTSQVNVSSDGSPGYRPTYSPEISSNGAHIVFWTNDPGLTTGLINGQPDVFVRHHRTGITQLVSVSTTGVSAMGSSYEPSISSDGRWIAFESTAENLILTDTNYQRDIFVRDMQAGITERVSRGNGAESNGNSFGATISGDGRFVAYQSWATNLTSNDMNGWQDVFLFDRQTGLTQCLSLDSSGATGNGFSTAAAISEDGQFVTFVSTSSNLVPADSNGLPDIFLFDRSTGNLELVSQDSNGVQGNSTSTLPSISADGRYVAFGSLSTNLIGNDTNGLPDIFLRDRLNGTTERISVSSSGLEANSSSFECSVSADGNQIAFRSYASNLVNGDLNAFADIFLHDRLSGETIMISVSSTGLPANGRSELPSISDDGKLVTYQSLAQSLVVGHSNIVEDIFLWDEGPVFDTIALIGPSTANPGGSVTYAWNGAPAFGDYRLMWSPSQSGQILRGHAFDLGSPIQVAALGINDSLGKGSFTTTIPASASGRTFYIELGSASNGVIMDSNMLTLSVN
jgi:Tol biopolymer transport system component